MKIDKSNKGTAAKITTPGAVASPKPPALPAEKVDPKTLPVTDPRRKLSKDEYKALSKEQRKERARNVKASRPTTTQRLSRTVGKMGGRCNRLTNIFKGTELSEAFSSVSKTLRELSAQIGELPKDWTPARTGSGAPRAAKFTAGQVVKLAPKFVDQYVPGFFSKAEADDLRVEAVAGGNVKVKVNDKLSLVVPANRLEVTKSAQG